MAKPSCPQSHTPVVEASPTSATPVSGPRGRSTWAGLLQFSLVAVPVKAYPAADSSADVHFNQLHADCGQRIRYEKHCPAHGKVDAAAIVRGYQYAPDQYVVVDVAELEALRPAKDKALILERFLDAGDIEPIYFSGRTLYLLPDGLGARRPYAVLLQAMQQRRKWALGRVVLSGHRHLVLVRPRAPVLAMDVLYYPEQFRQQAPGDVDGRGQNATQEELQLAGTLIDGASGPIDWRQYRDDSAAELAALIEAKVKGQPLAPAVEEPVTVLSLLDALKQSVATLDRPSADPQPRKKVKR